MKYLLFIVLMVAVLIIAGCVGGNQNSVIKPTQTTPAPSIIVTTIVQTPIQINPIVGVWKCKGNNNVTSEIYRFDKNGSMKISWMWWGATEIIVLGRWRKNGTNQYEVIYNKNVGNVSPYTKGETGESIYPLIYHPETDTITQASPGHVFTFYRFTNIPSSSSLEQINLSGEFNEVESFKAIGNGVRIFTMKHTGSRFRVVLKDEDGNRVALLVNKIGPYSGKKSEMLTSGTYYLDITADSSWTIDISSM